MIMKAIVVNKDGFSLEWKTVAPLHPEAGEVLVQIRAAGVNRADLLQRRGLYDPPPGASEILGLECSGEIAELGSDVKNWKIGDRVCALLGGGGYAEQAVIHQDMLMPVPDRLSPEESAAIPEAFGTAYLNLFLIGMLAPGETVLIHSGGSGVGTAAIQLAKNGGANIFVTTGDEKKIRLCRELGADGAVNYKEENFAEKILETTRGVDIVLDTVGGKYLAGNLRLLTPKGRLILIGLLGGGQADINLTEVLTKNISVIGSTLRNKTLKEKIALTQKMITDMLPLFAKGIVKPVVDSVFPIELAEQAHRRMLENKNFGKIILKIS